MKVHWHIIILSETPTILRRRKIVEVSSLVLVVDVAKSLYIYILKLPFSAALKSDRLGILVSSIEYFPSCNSFIQAVFLPYQQRNKILYPDREKNNKHGE